MDNRANAVPATQPNSMQNYHSGAITVRTSHVPALDGLRGVAILLVLALHFMRHDLLAAAGPHVELILGRAIWPMRFGVELFFVLSGFLITGILRDTKHTPGFFRNFYARRTLRIFPLYFGALAVVLLAFADGGADWCRRCGTFDCYLIGPTGPTECRPVPVARRYWPQRKRR